MLSPRTLYWNRAKDCGLDGGGPSEERAHPGSLAAVRPERKQRATSNSNSDSDERRANSPIGPDGGPNFAGNPRGALGAFGPVEDNAQIGADFVAHENGLPSGRHVQAARVAPHLLARGQPELGPGEQVEAAGGASFHYPLGPTEVGGSSSAAPGCPLDPLGWQEALLAPNCARTWVSGMDGLQFGWLAGWPSGLTANGMGANNSRANQKHSSPVTLGPLPVNAGRATLAPFGLERQRQAVSRESPITDPLVCLTPLSIWPLKWALSIVGRKLCGA